MSLKESIQKLETELDEAIQYKVGAYFVDKIKRKLEKLYRKRDEVFARAKAEKHGKILLRDYPVPVHQIPGWKKAKEDYFRDKNKKVIKNPYLEDHGIDKESKA